MAATAPLSPSPHDREVIRSLMARTHEAATESRAGGQAEAWRRLNDLEPTRTLVWVNEEPWTELQHEFPEELTPVCADPFLQGVERGLRMQLFRWTHYRADMVVNDRIDSPMAIRLGDIGVPVEEAFIRNEGQDIGSHGFRRTINTLEDVARIEAPDVIHDPEETERRLTVLRELADGVIAVEPRGVSHQWFALWDRLIRNLGVQDAMLDLFILTGVDVDDLVAANFDLVD